MTKEEFLNLSVAKQEDVVPGSLFLFQYDSGFLDLCMVVAVNHYDYARLLWTFASDDHEFYNVMTARFFRLVWSPAREGASP